MHMCCILARCMYGIKYMHVAYMYVYIGKHASGAYEYCFMAPGAHEPLKPAKERATSTYLRVPSKSVIVFHIWKPNSIMYIDGRKVHVGMST